MISEKIISHLVTVHVIFGGTALIAGLTAIIAKKGTKLHKVTGKMFFFSMLISGLTALIISAHPNHQKPFLFSIGIFTLYFVISGFRAIRFKQEHVNLNIDKTISIVMLITGILMIVLPIILHRRVNIVLAAFGGIGTIFALKDLSLFRQKELLRDIWLTQHLSKMLGGYISTVTAFVVANQLLPGMVGWFGPSILGSIYIAYWVRKLKT